MHYYLNRCLLKKTLMVIYCILSFEYKNYYAEFNMQRALWFLVLQVTVGFNFSMHSTEHNACLQHFEIFENMEDSDSTDQYPAARSHEINFLGGDEMLFMPCAGIEIDAYMMQSFSDRNKIEKIFGNPTLSHTTSEHLVYLRKLEIYGDKDKNQGLGKQLFLYGLIKVKQQYPKSNYFWIAEPLDGPEKREDLFRFYKNCGGSILKDYGKTALFCIALAKLDLGLFKPTREISEYLSIHTRF